MKRLALSSLCVLAVGCARRELTVTSDPPGALVFLNGEEVGRTPLTTPFTWYGTYDVRVRKDGYETVAEKRRLVAPWWGWPPLDLLAELSPARFVDRQAMSFALTPRASETDASAGALLDRAESAQARNAAPARE